MNQFIWFKKIRMNWFSGHRQIESAFLQTSIKNQHTRLQSYGLKHLRVYWPAWQYCHWIECYLLVVTAEILAYYVKDNFISTLFVLMFYPFFISLNRKDILFWSIFRVHIQYFLYRWVSNKPNNINEHDFFTQPKQQLLWLRKNNAEKYSSALHTPVQSPWKRLRMYFKWNDD